eukprot:811816-Rhodomonas_salina.2
MMRCQTLTAGAARVRFLQRQSRRGKRRSDLSEPGGVSGGFGGCGRAHAGEYHASTVPGTWGYQSPPRLRCGLLRTSDHD